MTTPNKGPLDGKGPYRDDQSAASKGRTTDITSQDRLKVPSTEREDLPEADRKNFRNGVFTGSGTGVAPGNTDVGGADTRSMEEHPKMGTTGETTGRSVSGGSIDRSSSGSDRDAGIDDPA